MRRSCVRARTGRSLFILAIVPLLFAPPVRAGTYVVENLSDSGLHSLRWAIQQANAGSGSDTILFEDPLSGGVIRPASELPYLTGYYGDTINGDTDDDGDPDITLSGELLEGFGNGLLVARPLSLTARELVASLLDAPLAPAVPGATVAGLAIVGFPVTGITVNGRGGNTIRSCHIGVDRAGDTAIPNGLDGILISYSDDNTVGSSSPAERNVIVGGPANESSPTSGVRVLESSRTRIIGNHFGLNRAGTAAIGHANNSVHLAAPDEGGDNQVGGSGNRRNIFGGDEIGVLLSGKETGSRIVGNYFGLGRDGSTPIPLLNACISVEGNCGGNRIGGTTAAARNVFVGNASTTIGIHFRTGAGARNRVQGNDFGATADGTEQRPLLFGIILDLKAPAQTIGGDGAGEGNYFTAPQVNISTSGQAAGNGTVVSGNTFGELRSGSGVPITTGVSVGHSSMTVTGNVFARAVMGVRASSPDTNARVFRNRFRGCAYAVMVSAGSQVRLGNLSNASTADDGGNVFRDTNTYHIYNHSANVIRAEGNSFDTTVKRRIHAKIWDKRDDPACGRVDFDPLAGGVIPTGEAGSVMPAVTGAAAVPAARGAEVSFTLSAPAAVTVEVLNVAGRPVATVANGLSLAARLQRLTWGGQTAAGLAAPAGTYLVRITARGADGSQANAVTTLNLRR